MARPALSFDVVDEDVSSPIDGLGEIFTPRQNVMFGSLGKAAQEPLPSRIVST